MFNLLRFYAMLLKTSLKYSSLNSKWYLVGILEALLLI